VLDIVVDRAAARFASWYELFPRSAGTTKGQSGTFDDVIDRLEEIEWMGFDVIYFPPIHPIGEVNRKGPNNTLNPLPGDPGCPYAIGSAEGGHDAVEPSLGTLQDFRRLVEAARRHGLEIALDFAVQAAPDHPWSTSHPNWFYVRPDGTIKYAENPPKKYEDIYSLNFGSDDWAELWQELRRILLFWIDQGVTTFRVDNPHTKPISFWRWIIREIQDVHPEVIFLSEAFTRPKVMKALAKAGFTQSYTYFTWRNFKQEILEYFTELTNPPVSDYMRGNLFPNTPDILPKILQEGGRPAFKIRGTLAATLSSVYGIYSGFELCEATAIEGKEEYVNSEKYELKVWDWDRPGNIKDYIALINNVRRRHPALQEYDNLKFYWSDNDNILCYGKSLPSQADYILIVLNLDPYLAHESMIHFPVEDFGLSAGEQYEAHDLISNARYFWTGGSQYVRLDPHTEPAHIFAIRHWNRVDYVESGA
jgi:starch synthase (maltosyl-transferring)